MAKARATAGASASLPNASGVPEGMQLIGNNYADNWKPEVPGDHVVGAVVGEVRTVEFEQKRGKKVEKVTRRVIDVANEADATVYAVWESAALTDLFDRLHDEGAEGHRVYIRFDGLGKEKPGQNPPKLFTVALS